MVLKRRIHASSSFRSFVSVKRMRHDRDASRRVDHGESRFRVEPELVHMGGLSLLQIQIEGLLDIFNVTFVLQHGSNVKPADLASPGSAFQFLQGDVHAQVVEFPDDPRVAFRSGFLKDEEFFH